MVTEAPSRRFRSFPDTVLSIQYRFEIQSPHVLHRGDKNCNSLDSRIFAGIDILRTDNRLLQSSEGAGTSKDNFYVGYPGSIHAVWMFRRNDGRNGATRDGCQRG